MIIPKLLLLSFLFFETSAQLDKTLLSEEEEQSLNEVRIEVAKLIPYTKRSRRELGAIIYLNDDGDFSYSDPIEGDRSSFSPTMILRDNRLFTKEGLYGVDGVYEVIEVMHTHPYRGSSSNFSGGKKTGDIWWAERYNTYLSVIWKNQLRLYKPKGLNLDKKFRESSGELICKNCF